MFARRTTVLAALALALLTGGAPASKPPKEKAVISGPYAYENLSIFLLHGEDRLKGRKLVTLADALALKKVVVHETGSVGELSIENKSEDDVFIQAGDIVKGGRQDRVLSRDAILPPRSGKIPIASFCVEQGRWQKRGGESDARFESSGTALSTKALKIAARKKRDQGEVWKEVEETQNKLGRNIGKNVKSGASATSLQLTLESGDVEKAVQAYMKALAPAVDGKDDVVGFAFAIDGKVNSAEVYASPKMMKMMWTKMLRAAAVEAIAEKGTSKGPPAAVAAGDVEKLLAIDPAKSKVSEEKLGKKLVLTTIENDGKILFETSDDTGGWLHRSYY